MINIRTYFTNNFVFNNPDFDYKDTNLDSKSIIFIKKNKNIVNDDNENYIPCLFIQEKDQSSKFLIFFHGNSVDIFMSELIGQYFSEKLKMNVIIVEYPGYSIYNAKKSAETMCYDSLIVYSFIKENFKLTDEDIYVVGRSIGTGPAVYLASKNKPKGLILISPFKSIKSIKGAFIGFFLLDIFKSIDIIDKVTSPVLFIHGKNDHLIDYSHSEELLEKLDTYSDLNKNKIILNPNMTHNDMDLEKDIFDKIIEFVYKNNFKPTKGSFNYLDKKFKQLFDIPLPIQKYLLTLNINLEESNIISKDSRFSLLLHDERVAFVMNNFQIEICEPEEMEIELIIKTNELGQVNSLSQLSNGILIAYSDYYIAFYSIKKFKSDKLKLLEFKNSIIKVEEYNANQILVLTKGILFILNKEYNIDKDYKVNFQNMKVVGSFIAFQITNKILIFNYENKEINKKKEINFDETKAINNLINIENKYLVYLDKANLNKLVLENFYLSNYNFLIEEPSFIFNLCQNLIIIGNENGDIQIVELRSQNTIKSICFKNKKFNSYNSINSIIALKEGKLIISYQEIKKFKMHEEGNVQQSYENCVII